jgi:hypothetical protein
MPPADSFEPADSSSIRLVAAEGQLASILDT